MKMKAEMLKHFPNLKMKSESEMEGCKFNWTDVDTDGANSLEIHDVKVQFFCQIVSNKRTRIEIEKLYHFNQAAQ